MKRSLAVLLALILFPSVWMAAQEGREKPGGKQPSDMIERLQVGLDTATLVQPLTLKEFLAWIHTQTAAAKKPVFFTVNTEAFKDENPEMPELDDTEVRMTFLPNRVTVPHALRAALSKLPTGNATFLVRKDHIEITTWERAKLASLLRQPVLGRFSKVPLTEALEDLSEEYAVSILVDPRVAEEAKLPVSATFRNDTALEEAVRMLADMAGLKLVRFPTGLYITNPDNVPALEREVGKRRREMQNEPDSPQGRRLQPAAE